MAGAPATLPAHHGRHKGQLVLGPAAHHLSQKSRLFVAAIPTGTHVTVMVPTNRRPSPTAFAINADDASPGAVPAGLGQTDTASGTSRTNNPVNRSPIAPAEAPNARSHPRTVEAGWPHLAAILRCPHPSLGQRRAPRETPPQSRYGTHLPIPPTGRTVGRSTCEEQHNDRIN